jgi:poly(3-hydroxybutyrate) depolymerase
MSAGCGKAPGIASGMYNNGSTISISSGNQQRRFILNVPTNYDNTKPYKLVIAYHQLDGNDKQMYANDYYHLLDLSQNSAIFVAPNGQTRSGGPCMGTGNGEGGCGWPDSSGANLAFIDAVIQQIQDNFCIDNTRIFATGWSYGGSMSYRTACSRPHGGTTPWGVRAVAAYSAAQLSGVCTPTKPVAYFASHGTRDGVLSYDNNTPDGGGVALAKNFATVNGCTWMTPTKVSSGAHVCTQEMACTAGYPVRFCSFNGDHTPDPDNGQSGNSWLYQEVWTFFSQF